ncbi:hypothetical protein AVEN_87580-1 [Araneus ventricosus]|uniref:Uncharacterized protein n=1 Tax=Araneus ventricosus TaxID=182803 RepID=A0A4Y2LRW7_ARAVE|nr:hypothetical protein AVEN_87580-1 [Araneus ventricosus]
MLHRFGNPRYWLPPRAHTNLRGFASTILVPTAVAFSGVSAFPSVVASLRSKAISSGGTGFRTVVSNGGRIQFAIQIFSLFTYSLTSYIPSEICPKSPKSFLKFSAINTRIETVSFQPKVPEHSKDPPDFSDFKTVTHKKKFKKDSLVNQDNLAVDKVSQYYKPPQLSDKEPSEASNSAIKQNNIIVINSGTKSHVCSVGPVPESMSAFPPEKTKVLQSVKSEADADMNSSSASEGHTLEYDMFEDLEDTPQNVFPTTLPPPSTALKR